MIKDCLLQIFIFLTTLTCVTPLPAQLPHDKSLMELNYIINENTLHWVTVRSFEKQAMSGVRSAKLANGSEVEFFYRSEDVTYNSHTGTHLDAPCHFAKDAWCVNEIPVEHLMDLPAYSINVRHKVEVNENYQVTVEDLKAMEKQYWIPKGSLLFIETSWSRKWPIREDYFGIKDGNEDELHFPGISPELADYIVNRSVYVGVGIESPSIDPGFSVDKYAHRTLFANNIYAIENVPNMGKFPLNGYARVTVAPLKIEGGSGSPVRIFVKRLSEFFNPIASLANNSKRALTSYQCILLSLTLLIPKHV